MKAFLPTLITCLGLAAAPAALAQGCCSAQTSSHTGCTRTDQTASCSHDNHSSAQTAAPAQTPVSRPVLVQPVQSVFDHYIRVQLALAQDSLQGLDSTAAAISKAIRADSGKVLSLKVAEQAEALGQAKDLDAARTAFKALSESLINYLKAQPLPAGAYFVAYCPMAKASWLQADKTIINPYMGKGMIHCGQIKS